MIIFRNVEIFEEKKKPKKFCLKENVQEYSIFVKWKIQKLINWLFHKHVLKFPDFCHLARMFGPLYCALYGNNL